MTDRGRRRRMAAEAARRLAQGGDIRRARIAAARSISRDWVPEDQLPSAAEIGQEIARQRLSAEPDPAGGLGPLIGDRLDRLAALLRPAAVVRLDPAVHAAATLLDASLVAFACVERQRPYDEELLTAALLADAGKLLDRRDPVAAILAAATELITERTAWLIEHRDAAVAYESGELGHRARQRLVAHPDFDAVLLLAEASRESLRERFAELTLDEAVAVLRQLAAE